MGDGRVEGSSAIGDGRQSAISLMSDTDETHICIFESSKLEGLVVHGEEAFHLRLASPLNLVFFSSLVPLKWF